MEREAWINSEFEAQLLAMTQMEALELDETV